MDLFQVSGKTPQERDLLKMVQSTLDIINLQDTKNRGGILSVPAREFNCSLVIRSKTSLIEISIFDISITDSQSTAKSVSTFETYTDSKKFAKQFAIIESSSITELL